MLEERKGLNNCVPNPDTKKNFFSPQANIRLVIYASIGRDINPLPLSFLGCKNGASIVS